MLTPAQSAMLNQIEQFRTAALGGHVDICDDCGYKSDPSYNSCRNRHCPKCQSSAARKWILARTERLLPTHYFHMVFTLQAELRGLAMRNRTLVFNLIFSAASATLLELGEAVELPEVVPEVAAVAAVAEAVEVPEVAEAEGVAEAVRVSEVAEAEGVAERAD